MDRETDHCEDSGKTAKGRTVVTKVVNEQCYINTSTDSYTNWTQLYETVTRHLSNFVLGAEHSAQYLCDRSTPIGRNDALFSTEGDAYQVVLKDYPDEVNSVLQSAEDEMKYAHELLQSAEESTGNPK